MARTFDTTIIQALNAETTTEAFLALLTFTHSEIDTVRVVNNMEDITSNSNTFTAFPFSLVLPADTEEFQPRFRVRIDNAAQLLIDELRGRAGDSERIECKVEIIAASDPDTIMASWSEFKMVNVQYTADVMTFDLSVEDYLTEPFPGDSFSPNFFPGLY